MKSIRTHYLPATNFKPSRIVATAEGGPKPHRIVRSMDYELDMDERHAAVAQELAHRLGWTGTWIGGGSVDQTGYVWVNTRSSLKFTA